MPVTLVQKVFNKPGASVLHFASQVCSAIDYIKQSADLEQGNVLATVRAMSIWLERDAPATTHAHYSTSTLERHQDNASYERFEEDDVVFSVLRAVGKVLISSSGQLCSSSATDCSALLFWAQTHYRSPAE
jgi:hypothetical protein